MASLVPIILKILYEKKVMTKEEIISEITKIIDIEADKVSFRLDKLLEQKKLYFYQETGIALENHGDLLEDEIEKIMNKIFYKPFVFRNPKIKGDSQELCDILVYAYDTLILFQAKTNKFTGNYERFVNKAVTKSIFQLKTSINRCKNRDYEIELIDIHGRVIKLNKEKIKKIYGVCVAYQIEPILTHDKARLTYNLKLDEISEIPHILSDEDLRTISYYFDTPKDFTDYLTKRELVCNNPKHMLISEKDIITLYYISERTMTPKSITPEEYWKADSIFLDGMEEDLVEGKLSKQIKQKKDKEKESYAVDEFINSIESECKENFEDIKIIEFFNSMNRFERRLLGEKIFLKFKECMDKGKDFGYFISYTKQNPEGYLIIFSQLPYKETEEKAEVLLKVAKAEMNQERIIGVIFQDFFSPNTLKYRFLINENPLSEEEKKELISYSPKFFKEAKEEKIHEFD